MLNGKSYVNCIIPLLLIKRYHIQLVSCWEVVVVSHSNGDLKMVTCRYGKVRRMPAGVGSKWQTYSIPTVHIQTSESDL